MNGELYEAMRKELRHAVEEIKTELEQVCDLFVPSNKKITPPRVYDLLTISC